jgi:hypothetical protein
MHAGAETGDGNFGRPHRAKAGDDHLIVNFQAVIAGCHTQVRKRGIQFWQAKGIGQRVSLAFWYFATLGLLAGCGEETSGSFSLSFLSRH